MKFPVTDDALKGGSADLDKKLLSQVMGHITYLIEQRSVPSDALPSLPAAIGPIDFYVGNVINGGHAQFVGNAGEQASAVLQAAAEVFEAARLTPFAEISKSALRWVKSNPLEAQNQTGFHGGISATLEALDDPFLELFQSDDFDHILARTVRLGANLVSIGIDDEAQLPVFRRSYSDQWLSETPEVRWAIARDVTQKMRSWFSNPLAVGLALAAGWENKLVMIYTEHVSLAPVIDGKATGRIPVFSTPDQAANPSNVMSAAKYELSPEGLSFEPLDGNLLTAPVYVPGEMITRAQELSETFRIPQSVGMRWWRTAMPFDLHSYNLYELPNWLPGKFWLRLMAFEWAVKGSPEKSTFIDFETEYRETIMQEELASLSNEAGLVEAGS